MKHNKTAPVCCLIFSIQRYCQLWLSMLALALWSVFSLRLKKAKKKKKNRTVSAAGSRERERREKKEKKEKGNIKRRGGHDGAGPGERQSNTSLTHTFTHSHTLSCHSYVREEGKPLLQINYSMPFTEGEFGDFFSPVPSSGHTPLPWGRSTLQKKPAAPFYTVTEGQTLASFNLSVNVMRRKHAQPRTYSTSPKETGCCWLNEDEWRQTFVTFLKSKTSSFEFYDQCLNSVTLFWVYSFTHSVLNVTIMSTDVFLKL